MRKYGKLHFFLVLGILLFIPHMKVSASGPLDEIEKETIWIDLESDGSMNITYEIYWKVLDSTSEGPLTWVKVGIPNEYVEDITALSDSIEKIRYYNDGGEYVRLDLEHEYEAGETVNMKFSVHQHRMYEKVSDGYKYSFTPGWFDDISVKELDIFWEYGGDTVSNMSFDDKEERYSAHYDNLRPAERVNVQVFYPEEYYQFNDDYKKSASLFYDYIKVVAAASGVIGIALYAVVLYARRNHRKIKDSYERNKGLGSVYVGSGHVRGRGGSGCACACACACAGGGRAGCSRKDFLHIILYSGRVFDSHRCSFTDVSQNYPPQSSPQ